MDSLPTTIAEKIAGLRLELLASRRDERDDHWIDEILASATAILTQLLEPAALDPTDYAWDRAHDKQVNRYLRSRKALNSLTHKPAPRPRVITQDFEAHRSSGATNPKVDTERRKPNLDEPTTPTPADCQPIARQPDTAAITAPAQPVEHTNPQVSANPPQNQANHRQATPRAPSPLTVGSTKPHSTRLAHQRNHRANRSDPLNPRARLIHSNTRASPA